MLFQTDLKTLRGALKRAARIFDRSDLATAHLLAHPGTLTIRAHCGGVERDEAIGALGPGQGAWEVDLRDLLPALEPLGDGQVVFSTPREALGPDGRAARVNLVPSIPPAPASVCASSVHVDRAGLVDALDRVSYAMSRDVARVNLWGVELRQVEAGLRWTATDGHRLASVTAPASDPFGLPDRGIFLSRRAATEISKSLREGRKAGHARIGWALSGGGPRWLHLQTMEVVVRARAESITPPPYAAVVSPPSPVSVTLDPREVLRVAKALRSAECIVLEVGPDVSRLRSPGADSAHRIPIAARSTSWVAVGVQPRYLADLVEHAPTLPDGSLVIEVVDLGRGGSQTLTVRGSGAVHVLASHLLPEGDPAHPKNRK